jgi:transcriptional regulator with XRE-family HTH domain
MDDYKRPKQEEVADRRKIILGNFDYYLKKKGITAKKYCKDNCLDVTTVSQWRSSRCFLSIEQLEQAANYFDITVNDLMYSEEEKKHIEVLADKQYNPILAKESREIRMIDRIFSKPLPFLTPAIIYIIVGLICFFSSKSSPFWVFLGLVPLLITFFTYDDSLGDRRTFQIPYEDDIFYRMENPKNQFYLIEIILVSFSSLSFLFSIFWLSFTAKQAANESGIVFWLFNLVSSLAACISCVVLMFIAKDKIKADIYSFEMGGFSARVVPVYLSLSNLCFAACYVYSFWATEWPIVVSGGISFFFILTEYFVACKKYSEYVLVYKKNGKDPRPFYSKLDNKD